MASKPEDQFAEEFVVSEEGLKADRPGTANTVAKVEKEDKAKTDPQKKQDEKTENALPKPGLKKKSAPAISSLNKYAQYDKYHPLNQPFPAIENFKGPKCRLRSPSREKADRPDRHHLPFPLHRRPRLPLRGV